MYWRGADGASIYGSSELSTTELHQNSGELALLRCIVLLVLTASPGGVVLAGVTAGAGVIPTCSTAA